MTRIATLAQLPWTRVFSLSARTMEQSASATGPFTHREQLLPQLAEVQNEALIRHTEEWLMRTPPVTTIRVNLLKTTVDAVKDRVRESYRQKYKTEQGLQFVQHAQLPEMLGICPLSDNRPQNIIDTATTTKEVIVDSNCGRSVLRGSHIFAPGVLAMSKHCAEGDAVSVYVDLLGKCKKGAHDLAGDPTQKMFVGVGRILQPRFKLYGEGVIAAGIAVDMDRTVPPHVPSIGDSYLEGGWGILQNLPSMLAVRSLSPQPGESILDMCAAPGHKTTHIVELMRDKGTVIALEKVAKKVVRMKSEMQESGVKSLGIFAFDASKCIGEDADGHITTGPPFPPNSFDRVLLDAPCSGLGNRPQLPGTNKNTAKMLNSYPVLQRQLFFAAVAALKPGGVLVYSTCTVNQQENELMVAWALQKFPRLALEDVGCSLGSKGWPTTGLTDSQLDKLRRFGPPESSAADKLNDSIGFFIAKFIKL